MAKVIRDLGEIGLFRRPDRDPIPDSPSHALFIIVDTILSNISLSGVSP